ncbi:hypothetical protein WN943_008377 [Citrus x changshan-huyou]
MDLFFGYFHWLSWGSTIHEIIIVTKGKEKLPRCSVTKAICKTQHIMQVKTTWSLLVAGTLVPPRRTMVESLRPQIEV